MFSTSRPGCWLPCLLYVPLGRVNATSGEGASLADFRQGQVCVDVGQRAIGGRWRLRERAQLAELVEPVKARDEQASVDRSGDARAVRDGGDDWDAEHVVDVVGSERAAFLGDE